MKKRKAKRTERRDAGRPRGQPIVEAVLKATLEELAATGPESLSVERVAQRAQVNKTSVYRRWPTRGALVAAALVQTATELGAQLDGAETPGEGLIEELTAFVMMVAARLESPGGKALVRAAMQHDSASPLQVVNQRLVELGQAPGGDFERRAAARGEWRRGVKAEQVLFTLVGAVLHRTLMEHAPITRTWARSIAELLALGVQPRQTTR